jgi:hypothetical protein
VVSPVQVRTNSYVPIVTPNQSAPTAVPTHGATVQSGKPMQIIDVDATQPTPQHIHNQIQQLQEAVVAKQIQTTGKSQVLHEMSVQSSQLMQTTPTTQTMYTPQQTLPVQQNLRAIQPNHLQPKGQTSTSTQNYSQPLHNQQIAHARAQENSHSMLSERQLQQMHQKIATPTSHVEPQSLSLTEQHMHKAVHPTSTQSTQLTEQQMHRAMHPYPPTQSTQPMTEQQLQQKLQQQFIHQQQVHQQQVHQQQVHQQQLHKQTQLRQQVLQQQALQYQNPSSAPSSPAVASPHRSPQTSQPSSPITTSTTAVYAPVSDTIPNEALVQLIVQHRLQTASLQRQHQERLSLLKELLSNQVINEGTTWILLHCVLTICRGCTIRIDQAGSGAHKPQSKAGTTEGRFKGIKPTVLI